MLEMYIHPIGIPMVMTYCILSGLAGVYTEWILKTNYRQSLHLQNVFLYTYGTLLNIVIALGVALINSSRIDLTHLFTVFSIYTWLIILSQVFNGLFMSVVIKHTSNIIRLFLISFSLIVTTVLSMIVFNIILNICFFISFGTMTSALSIYYKY
jgi:probable UDP-sugar transporter A4